MSSNIQDVIARLLGQPASIFGGQAPQAPHGQQWPQANDFGLSDPAVASPPGDFIVSQNPSQPLPPEQRMEGWRRFTTDFMYGLGSGLSAATQNPTGRGLRTQAGMGQILQQPMVLQRAKEALAQQKQEQDARKAQILLGILGQQQQKEQQDRVFDLNKTNTEADNALQAKNAEANAALKEQESVIARERGAAGELIPGTEKIVKHPETGKAVNSAQWRVTDPVTGGVQIVTRYGDEAVDKAAENGSLTPDKVMVDGVGSEVLRDSKGNYFDANTKKPITGRITPYIAPPNPRQKGEITPTAEANLMQNLNKQWEAASKDVQQLYRANTIMNSGMVAARRGDLNAGAQAVLVTFQKFLDPTSVVRESEYARSGAGQSVANQVRGYIDKLEQGGAGMTLPELEKFAVIAQEIANNLNKEGASLLSAEKTRIKKVADRYDIPIDTIIPDYSYANPGGSTSSPKPATTPANIIRYDSQGNRIK